MPSKALIEAANAFHRRHDFAAFGLTGAPKALRADIPAVLARVRRLRDDFVKGPEAVPGKLGERALSGRARLLGPGRVEVDGREIGGPAIILAPGSRPIVPGPDWTRFGDRILTTDTLFEQRTCRAHRRRRPGRNRRRNGAGAVAAGHRGGGLRCRRDAWPG
jgi:dihydrolipoamide dehydrogenase